MADLKASKMTEVTVADKDIWLKAFIAAIASGRELYEAVIIADDCLKQFNDRFKPKEETK